MYNPKKMNYQLNPFQKKIFQKLIRLIIMLYIVPKWITDYCLARYDSFK